MSTFFESDDVAAKKARQKAQIITALSIDKALLSSLLNWGTSNPEIEKINLRVHATNERAIALYKKFEFEQEGVQKRDLKLGQNHYVDTILMGRFVK